MTEFPPAIMNSIRHAADIIRESRIVIALTGAGVSTRSGIPDFRSPNGGLWTRFDPLEVASLIAFRYNPAKFFGWIRPLAREMVEAEPNGAHIGLARLENEGRITTIITQNIDGLHQRAGAKHVLEVHGTMQTLSCVGCYQQFSSAFFIEPFIHSGQIPSCPNCGNILKPDIVLFGEQMPARTWNKAVQACSLCDTMIIAGSSLEVMPVAGLPIQALEAGAHLILINQTPTYIDERADVVIHDDAADILPKLAEEVIRD